MGAHGVPVPGQGKGAAPSQSSGYSPPILGSAYAKTMGGIPQQQPQPGQVPPLGGKGRPLSQTADPRLQQIISAQSQPGQSGLNAQPGSWNIGPQNYTPQQGWNISPPQGWNTFPPKQQPYGTPQPQAGYGTPQPQGGYNQPQQQPQGGYNPPGDGYARHQEHMAEKMARYQEHMAERMARRDDRGGNGQGYGLRQLSEMGQPQPMQVPGVPRTISGFDPGQKVRI